MKKLTNKETAFCNEYIVDLNGTQAATRAGYSKKTACAIASENLRKPHIQEYIVELQRERTERLHISQDNIVKNLLHALDIALGKEITYVPNRDGKSDEVRKTDLPSVLKIQEMLGKHIGFFEKDNNKKVVIEDLSKYTLEQLIERDKLTD